jgi:uncharacterized protein YbjT (DUF2867 family)
MSSQHNRTAVIAGASGLVGSYLLKQLLEEEHFDHIIALVRKPLPLHHPKLEQRISDFSNLHDLQIPCEACFCCLGSTMAKAGSKEAFYVIDHDYPVNLAKGVHDAGSRRFFVISAMGANASSSIFYNRVKGEMERDLQQLGFETLAIFRPGLLMGPRKEKRTGEAIARKLFAIINPILPSAYKGVQAESVAQAMLHSSISLGVGFIVLENKDLIQGKWL